MEPFIKINGQPFPYPKRGLELITSTFVDSARNTQGQVVGQKVGRDQYKINRCEWPVLTAEQWSQMLAMLNDFFVIVTFPDQVSNSWRSLKMYPGDRSAEPYWLDEVTGLPKMYRNCRVNLIDAGYDDAGIPPTPSVGKLQKKIVSSSPNADIVVKADPGYDGLSEVRIEKWDLSGCNVTPEDIKKDKRAYGPSGLISGTMNTAESLKVIANPLIEDSKSHNYQSFIGNLTVELYSGFLDRLKKI